MTKRRIEIGKCTLINGDAMDVLDTIENESFDGMVTDPPFGIGFNYNGEIEETKDPESYWEWFGPIYEKMLEKVKRGGFVSVWQTQLYFEHFWAWFGKDIHIYAGCKNFVQLRKTPINYSYDPIVMLYKPGAKPLAPQKQEKSIDYGVYDYVFDGDGKFLPDFFVANTANFDRRDHPCPRPIGQVDQIIKNFTIKGANILDGFMGWATVGVSCLKNGRSFTGIEKDDGYFTSAVSRVEKEWRKFLSSRATLDAFTRKV